jgi:DNA-directed RNA polymerase specialized sigma24 family protein
MIAMTDDKLLAWYNPDPAEAKEEHQRHHKSLLMFMRRRNVRDAQGAVGEIFARVVAKLAADEFPEIKSEDERGRYLFGYAKNVCKEFLKQQQQFQVSLDSPNRNGITPSTPAAGEGVHEGVEKSALRTRVRACFGRCLNCLKREDVEMLLEYYRGEKGRQITIRKALAERLGLTMNALTLRVRDRRKTLRQCVEPCLAMNGLQLDDLKLLGYNFID